MKLLSTYVSLITLASSIACAGPEQWEELDGVIRPLGSTGYTGAAVSTPSASISSDKWDVYYSNKDWKTENRLHPNGADSLMIGGAKSSNGSSSSQLSTRFTLTDEQIADASKVRLSFDLNYIDPESALGLSINVDNWHIISVTPGFGRMAPLAASSGSSQFQFGLMDLASNTCIPATLSHGDTSVTVSSYADLWAFPGGLDKVTISFDIDESMLQAGSAGYALMIGNSWGGASGKGEYFYVDNVQVKKLVKAEAVPEPASALLVLMGLAGLAVRRR